MPVFTSDETPKRFIVPSTESGEQGWVEMRVYPLCSDDYSDYFKAEFAFKQSQAQDAEARKLNPRLPPFVDKAPQLNNYILAERIVDWNYVDAVGAKHEVTAKNIGRFFKPADIFFLVNSIHEEALPEVGAEEKKTSSATSSPSTTESK